MYYEKIFNTEVELLSPPQTPSCGEGIFSDLGFDAELLSFNFTLQDLADDFIITKTFRAEVLRDDCMWGESELKCSNSPSDGLKNCRSLLVTPINFTLNPSPATVNDDLCCDTTDEYSLLTPADTESGK